MQSCCEFDLTESVDCEVLHAIHPVAPELGLYVPTGHGVQTGSLTPPVVEYVPGGHSSTKLIIKKGY